VGNLRGGARGTATTATPLLNVVTGLVGDVTLRLWIIDSSSKLRSRRIRKRIEAPDDLSGRPPVHLPVSNPFERPDHQAPELFAAAR
jgi:hypothetical protein